ncbi:MAG: hypothetical protein ACE5O2_15795, partial [Armatimonadota bacterium]
FMVRAIYPEWATKRAPLILADACTYGRASRFLPQTEALEANRQRLLERMKVPKEAGIPFIYAGGIDPVVAGADPEFSGKNAVMISEATDGYWIFYEGPKYDEDHPEYWKWFTWANKAITEGRLEAWREPRETPEEWTLDVFKQTGERPRLIPPEVTGEKVEPPMVRLRGENILLVAAKAGQSVDVVLKDEPVAHYQSRLLWDLRDTQMTKIASGMILHGDSGTVSFVPKADGVYLLGASAGSCGYSVVSTNAPIGLWTRDGVSLIYGAKRLYFKVPEWVEEFTVSAKGSGAETVRVNVLDPDGKRVATGQTTAQQGKVEIAVPVAGRAGEVWSLEVARADQGVLEDNTIKLDEKLPPTLSLIPEHVFDLAPEQ